MKAIKVKKYEKMLRTAGFTEAEKRRLLYFREVREDVAFIVDLEPDESAVTVYYGFASTAFVHMAGCQNALRELGVDKDSINLRYKLELCSAEDEKSAEQKIGDVYREYSGISKDELLALAKEMKKRFLSLINERLKPYGFKKKGSQWKRALDDTYELTFFAEKLAYSDLYRFNVYIGQIGSGFFLGPCFHTTVSPDGNNTDWQTVSFDGFCAWLDSIAENVLKPIINTPLAELGKNPKMWPKCICSRKQCPSCWVEKNLWESMEQT